MDHRNWLRHGVLCLWSLGSITPLLAQPDDAELAQSDDPEPAQSDDSEPAPFVDPAEEIAARAAASGSGRLDVDWFAFAQLTAEHRDGDGGVDFGADRLRYRVEVRSNRVLGAVMLDLGPDDLGDSKPGAFANVIADLFLQYDLDARHRLRFGQFKTPLGMDFNTGGGRLDITKRGMEAGLVLQREVGLMMSGRSLGAFGYDIGVFNIAGRAPATAYLDSQAGDENAVVARGHFDSGPWHAEVAYGETGAAGGPGTADYEVGDLALAYRSGPLTAKLEWIEGRNVLGDPSRDENVYYLHGGYRLNERIELVARHYDGDSRIAGSSTRLSNTYLGFTWWAHESERTRGRLQVNYVVAGRDEAAYTGVSGFRDDALLVQFQVDVAQ